MIKKILIFTILLIMAFQTTAFAQNETGRTIFLDALYGAVIGAVLGSAFYLIDGESFGKNFGIGVLVGTLGGITLGVSESMTAAAEIDKDEIKLSIPTPAIEYRGTDTLYYASLLKVAF